jgi:hypothetical protein
MPLPLSLLRKNLRRIALAATAFVAASSFAQGRPADSTPDVRLEAHDGKSTFYLGEPIPLDLVFENHTGSPFMLNNTVYGDLSEKVEITPKTGWFQWQTQSGHDYASEVKLDDAPIRLPVRLDEGFIFREPGEYRVRVTTARLMRGSTLDGAAVPAITTNELTIELQPMPSEVEAAKLRVIRADLAREDETTPSGYRARRQAMERLATLQGDDALAEKIKLLEDGDDDFRSVYREAFATTHDLQKQLAQLEQAWTDPKRTPRYDTPDAIYETRSLLAKRSLQGWQMTMVPEHDVAEKRVAAEPPTVMTALLDSMPARKGESRTMGAYFLIEFGGLTEAQRARAVDYAVEEFPHMDDTEQHMLLETSRPPLRDPRLIPMLRSMLAANPSDKDATAALLAMAPEESTEWITKSICAPKGVVLLDTFKDAHVDRVPQADTCLAALLRVTPTTARQEFEWKQHATQAARFGTPSILPALHDGWKKPTQDSAALAVLMRNDPSGAVALLNRKTTEGKLDGMLFYETQSVYNQLTQPFPDEVLVWLRSKLADGTDKEASTAAYALSVGGDASDTARVEQRLERLRALWQGKQLSVDAQRVEADLASTLGSYGSKTFLDAEQRKRLGQGCISDMCKFYLH